MKRFLMLFYANFLWKVGSVLMAVGIWVVIRIAVVEEDQASRADPGPRASREFADVPIVLETTSVDPGRYELTPTVVNVVVEGQSSLLESTDENRIRVVADLTHPPDEEEFAIGLSVDVPEAFVFKSCDPQSVRVRRLE